MVKKNRVEINAYAPINVTPWGWGVPTIGGDFT